MSTKVKLKQIDFAAVSQDNSQNKALVITNSGAVYYRDLSTINVTYTNSTPLQVAIGNFTVGQTFNNVTMQAMWDYLLYPYQSPAFTSFTVSGGGGPFEVGDALPATITFGWNSSYDSNVNSGSIIISDTAGSVISGQNSDSTNSSTTSHTYSPAINRSSEGSYQWQITGTDTHNHTYQATVTKSWQWRVYWGTSASSALPDGAFVKSLLTSGLKSSRVFNYTFSSNNYKYLAIPSALGVPTKIYNAGLPFALADASDGYTSGSGTITYYPVSVENDFGVTATYNVFRSKSPVVNAEMDVT